MNIKSLITSVVLGMTALTAQAQEFNGLVEGKDYTKSTISNTVVPSNQDKPVLVEFFWYGCTHCNQIRQPSKQLSQKYGNKITHIKYPVGFENWESGARIFFTLDQMKIEEKLHDKIFDTIFIYRKNILSNQKLRDEFLVKNGVNIKQFNDIYNSFGINARWNKAKSIVASHQIEGSPHFAIYSKGVVYQVSPGKIGDTTKALSYIDKILAEKTK